MLRVLLTLFVCATPLAAQSADSASMLGSGSTVRLLLRGGPPSGSVGAVLGRSGDTLRVITPELGLAEVPLDDLDRLEVPSSLAGKMAIVVAGSAAAGTVAGLLQGESVVRSLVLGTALAAVVVIPAGASEQRRWRPIDPATRWRDAPAGARVRVSAPGLGFDRSELLLHDFRAGTLHLEDRGVMKPSPVTELTSLELSIGRDRRRGVRIGTAAGAIAGAVYGIAQLDGGESVALIPIVLIGFAVGGSVGGFSGFLLAPREWRSIPLSAPAPPGAPEPLVRIGPEKRVLQPRDRAGGDRERPPAMEAPVRCPCGVEDRVADLRRHPCAQPRLRIAAATSPAPIILTSPVRPRCPIALPSAPGATSDPTVNAIDPHPIARTSVMLCIEIQAPRETAAVFGR